MKKVGFLLSFFLCLSSFSCSKKEPSESVPSVIANGPLEYVLEDLSGTVLIQSADEALPEPAEEEQTVQAGDEIITQAGSEASLTLNETTMFHLSENSDVKVDQLARNDTQGFTSSLILAAGKILSEVEKLSKSNSTFEVNSGGVVCGVRGTSFEVEKQDSDIQTSTFNGSVVVQKDGNIQTVEANQHGDYSISQGAFQPKQDLTLDEKGYYENWKARLALIREKTRKRLEYLRSLDHLPDGEREKMLHQLEGVRAKDRLKAIQQVMRDRQTQINDQIQNQSRGSGSQASGETQEKAQGERLTQPEHAGPQRKEERPKPLSPDRDRKL
jgi:hypothetical protein